MLSLLLLRLSLIILMLRRLSLFRVLSTLPLLLLLPIFKSKKTGFKGFWFVEGFKASLKWPWYEAHGLDLPSECKFEEVGG